MGAAIDAAHKLMELTDQAAQETYAQCMRVLSRAVFCKCVSENNPVALNFIGFVTVNALEQGDQKLSDMDVKAVVNARMAFRKWSKA